MIPRFVRTAEQMKAARQALGLSADGLALMVRVEDGRTVRRWEAGERPIPGLVSVVLETALDFLERKATLVDQLQKLKSGELPPAFWAGEPAPSIDERIATTMVALHNVEDALVIITRQPPDSPASRSPNSPASRSVHWYTLSQMDPTPPDEGRWTLPGETSPKAALLYFEKETGIKGLELCEEGDPRAEFRLEQLVADRRDFGASQRIRPGALVETFYVRRAGKYQ